MLHNWNTMLSRPRQFLLEDKAETHVWTFDSSTGVLFYQNDDFSQPLDI